MTTEFDQTDIVRRMFVHLAALCRPVGQAADGVIAPAVYCHPTDNGSLVLVPAGQSGYEGVACVDDAARLLVLFLTAEAAQLSAIGRARCKHIVDGLLAFLLKMQTDDGLFVNFILDWRGSSNLGGATSRAGGSWWTGRALRALAWASNRARSPAAKRSFFAALPGVAFDDRWNEESLLMWAVLDFNALHDVPCGVRAAPWVDRLVAQTEDLPFRDGRAAEGPPQLWGRSQELVVARVAQQTGNRRWLSLARDSCHEFLRPLAMSGFRDRPVTLPYEVSSVVRNLRTVAAIAADRELQTAAEQASSWFWGGNRGGCPMVDVASGRASDGLDDVEPSRNSGAEANIETLFTICSAMPADLIWA